MNRAAPAAITFKEEFVDPRLLAPAQRNCPKDQSRERRPDEEGTETICTGCIFSADSATFQRESFSIP